MKKFHFKASMPNKKILVSYLVLSCFLLVFASCGFSFKFIKTESTNSMVEKDSTSLNQALGLQKTLRLIAKSVAPSVVNIQVTQKIVATNRMLQNPFDDFFKKFFGQEFGSPGGGQQQAPTEQKALGSGFIISKEGYIITNAHVVQNSTSIKVQTSDRHSFDAKLIGLDTKTDIALIKINADKSKLTVAPLGDSTKIMQGDLAIAIGNPFGLNRTFTFGVISAKGRNNFESNAPYKNYIQTDVAINQGNSGGPLLNIRGQVVGINSAIFSTSGGGSIGIGFSIPINIAKNVVQQIVKSGHVVRGSIGALVQSLDEDIAKYNGLKDDSGVIINDVFKGSPAAKGGLKAGDVVVKMNGENIKDNGDFVAKISNLPPKTKIKLLIVRNRKKVNLSITLGSKLYSSGGSSKNESSSNSSSSSKVYKWAGLTLMDAETARAQGYDVKANGVVVMEIDPSSKAIEKGLRPGAILKQIDHKNVSSLATLKKYVHKGKSSLVQFIIPSIGANLFIVLP